MERRAKARHKTYTDNKMGIISFSALIGTLLALYWSAEHLGFIAIPITGLSLIAIAMAVFFTRRYPRERFCIAAVLFMALFHIVGFTTIAYHSLESAWGFYGDFHSSYAPTLINRETAIPPFLGLWFLEVRALQLFLHQDNMTLILLVSLISRVLGVAAFAMLGSALGATKRGLVMGIAAFTFSYLLIPFTQGLKFVVGLPFFFIWAASFLRTAKKPDPVWLGVEFIAGFAAAFSEQWLTLVIAAAYAFTPLVKIAAQGRESVTAKDAICAFFMALAASALTAMEWARSVNGIRPLLSLQAHAHRDPQTDAVYALYFLFCAACLASGALYYGKTRKARDFKGYAFIIFGFAMPIMFAIGRHFAIMENILGSMKPVSVYWILGAPFWITLAYESVRRKAVDFESAACMAFAAMTAIVPVLSFFGIFVPLSPYLDGMAFALIVLCSHRTVYPETRLFSVIAYAASLAILGTVWLFRFVEYTDGWGKTEIVALIIAGTLLPLIQKNPNEPAT